MEGGKSPVCSGGRGRRQYSDNTRGGWSGLSSVIVLIEGVKTFSSEVVRGHPELETVARSMAWHGVAREVDKRW